MTTEPSDAARILELEADNRRLRRLLDEAGAPGSLRHRLRNTMALLRIVIRRSAETRRQVDLYVAHLEDRLDTLNRTQAAIDDMGTVSMHRMLASELHRYGLHEGESLRLEGPDFDFVPQSGIVMAMAFHELAVNAVEHGPSGADAGSIEVVWDIEADGSMLTIVWKEKGGVELTAPETTGFGFEVLTRTLSYEVDAQTQIFMEPDGLRATITMPITAKTGEPGCGV